MQHLRMHSTSVLDLHKDSDSLQASQRLHRISTPVPIIEDPTAYHRYRNEEIIESKLLHQASPRYETTVDQTRL